MEEEIGGLHDAILLWSRIQEHAATTVPAWPTKPTTSRIAPGAFSIRSPADFYISEMERHDTIVGKATPASFAINADPGCIEAHLFMGCNLRDPEQAMLHLRRAVETGDRLWGAMAEQEGDGMAWWGLLPTRPYMRSIQALGLAHREAGDEDEARGCLNRLLEMNPHDNQGIRYLVKDMAPAPMPFRLHLKVPRNEL